jgi:ATP-dependent DNA helicase RecG
MNDANRSSEGLLQGCMKGSGSCTNYLSEPVFETMGARAIGGLVPDRDLDTKPEKQSHQPTAQSRQLGEQRHHLLETLPADLRTRLPQPGSRLRRELLRNLIVDLFAWQHSECPLAAKVQISKARASEPIVAKGMLAYTIPEMENYPNQQYTIPCSPQN